MPLPAHIPPLFPALVDADCAKTSEQTRLYNCIAHAADPGNTKRWWQPIPGPKNTYWPPNVPKSRDLSAYEAAFATLGYQCCVTDSLDAGVEKIALFVDTIQYVTHAARQLPSGLWSSKLGGFEDISHPLYQLEGPTAPYGNAYGKVARIMCRARK